MKFSEFYLCNHNSCEIWHSFSRTSMRNFLWCYYRWFITSLALEKCKKKNALWYSSSSSEILETFTSMMGWGGGGRGHKLAQKKTENSDGYWKKSWKEKSSSMGLTFPDTNKEKAKRTFWHWKYFEWLTMDALLELFNLALVWMMKNIIKLMKLKSLVKFGHYLIFNTVMVVTMCRVENEWKQTTLYTKGN